jgi:hypothetical protein
MNKQQLIDKWKAEISNLRGEIRHHEETFGHPARIARERLETITEMLKDVRQLEVKGESK